jgi:transposase
LGLLKKADLYDSMSLFEDDREPAMLQRRARGQLEFFLCGSLRDLVPDDHVLARVDRVLDLSWLHDEVAEVYAPGVGRPAVDPEAAVRLMLAGFLLGIVHDRRLIREAQVNLAIRWFSGFGLNDRLPDHSSLTRIRQRWGAERFRRIFERTARSCVAAGIAKGEIVHVDASLIRADVAWESLAVRHVGAVAEANGDEAPEAEVDQALRDSKKTGMFKKVCLTDPDASMATSGRNRRLEPSYKQHSVVDDQLGVVLDVEVTTGQVNEGERMLAGLDAAAAITNAPIATVTADAGYAYAKIYAGLERRRIGAVIPAKAEPIRSPVPMRRFRYDARHDVLKCPRGKKLKPGRAVKHGRFFTSRARDCRGCDLASICLSKGRVNKAVVLGDDYPALLRARRRKDRWSDEDRRLYRRHRWRSEGYHGEAKTWHGLTRAVRRGLQNMRIQAFLTAAAINLKRLAAAILAMLIAMLVAMADVIETSISERIGPRAA